MMDYLVYLAWSIILLLTALIMAPLLDGVRRVIRAKVQRRMGPPVLQTFYDLRKLFGLPSLIPCRNYLLVLTPYLVFFVVVLLSILVPIPFVISPSSTVDIISFIYILLFASATIIYAALIIPNPYSNAGSIRELLLITLFELFIAFTIVGVAYKIGTLNMYLLSIRYGLAEYYLKPSTLLLSLSLLIIAYVEGAYTPFDIGEAETEVLGGPFLEYGGKYYGLLLYALLIKRYVLLALPVSLVFVSPIINYVADIFNGFTLMVLSYGLFIIFMFLTMMLFSVIEAFNPRYRVDIVYKPILVSALIPIIGFILGWFGW